MIDKMYSTKFFVKLKKLLKYNNKVYTNFSMATQPITETHVKIYANFFMNKKKLYPVQNKWLNDNLTRIMMF